MRLCLAGLFLLGRLQHENTLEISEYSYKLSWTLDKLHEFARSKINLAIEKNLMEYKFKYKLSKLQERRLSLVLCP